MKDKPTKSSAAGQAYLSLRKKARQDGRTTEELLQLAALEAFVDRLSLSSRASDLVLKGGVLLAAYDARRPTRDVDLSGNNISNTPNAVQIVIEEILQSSRGDGWVFYPAKSETIRENDEYSGVRVTVPCSLSSARVTFHVDVNVGDVLWPGPRRVKVPRLLGGSGIELLGYPLSMVMAEKIVTAIQRGSANTRWRDFADIYLLSGSHSFESGEIAGAIQRVAHHRAVDLRRLDDVLANYAGLAQNKWSAWVRGQNLTARIPSVFHQVISEVQKFADPVLDPSTLVASWEPSERRWLSR